MRTLFLVILISVSSVIFAQTKMMSLRFLPSFIKGAQLTISKTDVGYSMSLIGDLANESVLIQESSVSKIKDFMPMYFVEKQKEDSIERAKELEDEKKGIHGVNLDGITIKGEFIDQKLNRSFDFWSPNKISINFKLMNLIFELMNGSFVKPETVKYIKDLKGYFPR